MSPIDSRSARGCLAVAVVSLALAACSLGAPGTPTASGAAGTGATGSAPAAQPIPTLANVTLDQERAARRVIGPAGGTIEVTDGGGTTYGLVVPEGALPAETEIVAVPLTAVGGLPETLTIAAGVHLLPEGLSFRSLAELRITLAAPPAVVTMPFAYAGDLSEPHRYPARTEGTSTTFGLAHFSGYGLLAATSVAMAAAQMGLEIPWGQPDGPGDAALAAIAAALQTIETASEDPAINAALGTWLDQLKADVAAFQGITAWDLAGDYSRRASALHRAFNLWHYLRDLLALVAYSVDPVLFADLRRLVVEAANHGIDVSNSGCAAATTQELFGFRLQETFLLWQELAVRMGAAEQDSSLELEAVVARACAQVAFDPEGGVDFPSGIQPGQSGTLNIHVGYSIEGGVPRFDTWLDITVTPHGTAPDAVVDDLTGAGGTFSRQFLWDPAASELRLDIRACLQATPVCQEGFVIRATSPTPPPVAQSCPTFTATAGGQTATSGDSWSGISSSVTPAVGFANAAIGGNLVVSLGAAQNSASVEAGATFVVDSTNAGGGVQDVAVAWVGTARKGEGAAQGKVTLTVNGTAAVSMITGTTGDGGIRVSVPLTVAHGGVIEVSLRVEISSSHERGDFSVVGALEFATAQNVYVNQSECVPNG